MQNKARQPPSRTGAPRGQRHSRSQKAGTSKDSAGWRHVGARVGLKREGWECGGPGPPSLRPLPFFLDEKNPGGCPPPHSIIAYKGLRLSLDSVCSPLTAPPRARGLSQSHDHNPPPSVRNPPGPGAGGGGCQQPPPPPSGAPWHTPRRGPRRAGGGRVPTPIRAEGRALGLHGAAAPNQRTDRAFGDVSQRPSHPNLRTRPGGALGGRCTPRRPRH